MSKDKSIDQIQSFFGDLVKKGITPIAVGGDHTIPLPILRALKEKHGKMGILHIDAHADVLDSISRMPQRSHARAHVGACGP